MFVTHLDRVDLKNDYNMQNVSKHAHSRAHFGILDLWEVKGRNDYIFPTHIQPIFEKSEALSISKMTW